MVKQNILNLTPVENSIFNEILAGESSVGVIIKKLGLHRGTAYNSIRRLEEKGFVNFKIINGVKTYSVNLLYLEKLLKDKKITYQESLEKIKNLIQIAKTSRRAQKETKIQILIGEQGFKSFFEGLYEWAHKTRKEYLFLGKGNEMVEHLGLDYYKRTQLQKKKLGLKCRVILNFNSRSLPVAKYVAGSVRYLEMKSYSPTSLWIYGNILVMVLWTTKPITTMIIDSKEAATSFKNHFENLWKISQKIK